MHLIQYNLSYLRPESASWLGQTHRRAKKEARGFVRDERARALDLFTHWRRVCRHEARWRALNIWMMQRTNFLFDYARRHLWCNISVITVLSRALITDQAISLGYRPSFDRIHRIEHAWKKKPGINLIYSTQRHSYHISSQAKFLRRFWSSAKKRARVDHRSNTISYMCVRTCAYANIYIWS